jgi:hypothetical protein
MTTVLSVSIETRCLMVTNQTNIEVTLSTLLMSNFQMIPNFCFQLEDKIKLQFSGEKLKTEIYQKKKII